MSRLEMYLYTAYALLQLIGGLTLYRTWRYIRYTELKVRKYEFKGKQYTLQQLLKMFLKTISWFKVLFELNKPHPLSPRVRY